MYLGVSGSERSALCDRSAPRARASPKLASPRSSVRVIGDPRSGIRDLSAISFALSRALFSRTLLEGTRPAHLFGGLSAFYPVPLTRDSTSVPTVPAARWAPARRGLRLGNTRELGSLPRLCRGRGNWGEAQLVLCRIVHTPLLHCHTWHTLMQYKPTRATPTDTRASSKHPVRRARGLPRPLMTSF